LIAGNNLIAVEVHQDDNNSSDISFNVELSGNPAPAPPPVFILRYGDQLLVAWNEPAFGLEHADYVTGPWSGVSSGGSPHAIQINPSVTQKFYRLKR
jgi:hypothetical protein